MITFDAIGKPEPQGSAKAFVRGGRAHITSDNTGLRFWRNIVAEAARQAMGERNLVDRPEPVRVNIVFRLSRPASLPKRQSYATKKPDIDKLVRSSLDGMTGVVWRDDSQVIELTVRKQYCVEGEQPGARIGVEARDA